MKESKRQEMLEHISTALDVPVDNLGYVILSEDKEYRLMAVCELDVLDEFWLVRYCLLGSVEVIDFEEWDVNKGVLVETKYRDSRGDHRCMVWRAWDHYVRPPKDTPYKMDMGEWLGILD